jgi:GxxExxY protein
MTRIRQMDADMKGSNAGSGDDLINEDELDPRSIDPPGYKHSGLTKQIIEAFFKVYNTLGYGFLEKVYENAMLLELQRMGLVVRSQHPIVVIYEGTQVGNYYADLLVQDLVIVELKAAEDLCEEHECQLVNYLKATDKEIGLLLNFGRRPRIKRKIHTKHYLR